jgi:NAD(P)-dependent dehydrogenase (short-subunit alcohol dehydrogenase family)
MENQQIVLITGTSSGFGNLTAKTLATHGCTVYASMRQVSGKNAEKARELQDWSRAQGVTIHPIELDVTDETSIQQAVKEISQKEGRIDVLVNNAGVGGMGLSEAYTLPVVKRLFEVNVFGVFSVTKAVLPVMRNNSSGLIVHVSSEMGRMVLPFFGVYSATKYALEALAEAWRYELAMVGIDSVIVEPGAFPTTDFTQHTIANQAEETDIVEAYGEFAVNFLPMMRQNFEQMIQSGHAPDPQLVADAILNLVQLPARERPLRTIVDPQRGAAFEPLNKMTDNFQKQMLEGMRLGHLYSLRKQ